MEKTEHLGGKFFYEAYEAVVEARAAILKAYKICPEKDPVYGGPLNHLRHEINVLHAEMKKELHIRHIWTELNGDLNRAYDSEDREAAMAGAMGALNVTSYKDLDEVFARYHLEGFDDATDSS